MIECFWTSEYFQQQVPSDVLWLNKISMNNKTFPKDNQILNLNNATTTLYNTCSNTYTVHNGNINPLMYSTTCSSCQELVQNLKWTWIFSVARLFTILPSNSCHENFFFSHLSPSRTGQPPSLSTSFSKVFLPDFSIRSWN